MPVIRTVPGPAERPLALVVPAGEVVAASWEPCAAVDPGEPGVPVCERCGWLVDEHPDAAAPARRLRRAS